MQPDFEALFNLPLNVQNQIDTCANALPPNPTIAQAEGCNVPLMFEEVSGVRATLTFGGGVTVKLAKHLAAKGDIRYFKEIPTDDEGAFTFWRVTVGVVLHR